jgi:hypothetical protein
MIVLNGNTPFNFEKEYVDKRIAELRYEHHLSRVKELLCDVFCVRREMTLKRNQREYSSNRQVSRRTNYVVKSNELDCSGKKVIKNLIEQRWNEILAQEREEKKTTTERKHKERKLLKDKMVETARLVYERPDETTIQVKDRREAASTLKKQLASLEEEKQREHQRTLIETKQIRTALSLLNNKSIHSLIYSEFGKEEVFGVYNAKGIHS